MKDYNEAVSNLLDRLHTEFSARFPTLNRSFYVEKGRKYAKIIGESGSQRSALGFIVLNPVKNFVEGDILMASSWNAPALNFARGNIYEGDFERVTPHGVV